MTTKLFSLGFLSAIAMLLLPGCKHDSPPSRPSAVEVSGAVSAAPMVRKPTQYSYGYWLNGWKKPADDTSADVLCIEADQYGLMLDVDQLATPRFGRINDQTGYEAAAFSRTDRLRDLPAAALTIELEVAGKRYRATGCDPNRGRVSRPTHSHMWEAGRLAQHYDFLDLQFADEAGQKLPCYGSLKLVAWPGSLSLTAQLSPDNLYDEGPIAGAVGGGWCVRKKPLDIPHSPKLEPQHLTVACWVNVPEKLYDDTYGWLLCKNGNEWEPGNYGFAYRGGVVSACLNNAGGSKQETLIAQHGRLTPGTWHHLALTFDGKSMRFYVDGNEQGRKDLKTPRVPGNGKLRIGQRADGHFGVVNALYDQVQIWNRALSAREVEKCSADPATTASKKGLVFAKDFEASSTPVAAPAWDDATLRVSFSDGTRTWEAEKAVPGRWSWQSDHSVTVNCSFDESSAPDRAVSVAVATVGGQAVPVRYEPSMSCMVALAENIERDFAGGYVKITDYDEFEIVVDCAEDYPAPVPFLLDLRGPANITGLVPILCHEDGTPTGVHVQLSKNWHNPPMSPYLRAYALLPVSKGQTSYRLRIPYGFYGTLPSASHAQLCLIGYGGNQRWDQLALACGGESITFDVDMSLTDVAICDVRTPLGRQGTEGNAWGWTDAGWGGDWLGIFHGSQKKKATFSEIKTAYLSHGPCLSDAIYAGAYGVNRDVLVKARIQNPRTNDYGRTFQQLSYQFENPLDAKDSYLMKRHGRAWNRVVAYGNANGLLGEKRVTQALEEGALLLPPTELSGPGPWWVAFPEQATEGKTVGYISWIIDAYQASFGGADSPNPYLQVRIDATRGDEAKLEALLVPPPHVTRYNPGDQVAFDCQWTHLVATADNYGGSNEPYRQHLQQNPNSWETTYREVRDNRPAVRVAGGTVLQKLPVVVQVNEPQVTLTVEGGLGYLPVRFEGLPTARGYTLFEVIDGQPRKLDQSRHGNDFWQADYDDMTDTYKLTYNLPVDGKPRSSWLLKPEDPAPAK